MCKKSWSIVLFFHFSLVSSQFSKSSLLFFNTKNSINSTLCSIFTGTESQASHRPQTVSSSESARIADLTHSCILCHEHWTQNICNLPCPVWYDCCTFAGFCVVLYTLHWHSYQFSYFIQSFLFQYVSLLFSISLLCWEGVTGW